MKINKRLLIVLLVASLAPVIFFRIIEWRNGHFDSSTELIKSLSINGLISIVVTLTIAWVVLSILQWLNRKIPWTENILKRLFAEIGLTFPAALLLGYIFGLITYPINSGSSESYNDYIFSFLGISGIMNFVLVAISDWFYFFDRWKNSLVENEKAITQNETLEKEKIAAQYEALKNQINPHFLFNSLNVLSSIVHKDADKAEEFIDEFASLYRYILEHNEDSTVNLHEEISIAKSYAYLQKIRFGDAVDFNFTISEDEQNGNYVFPLSVQTVLENAVKHNSATKEKPLNIEVKMENDNLVIRNNLQLRNTIVQSTGIGTQNLILRYRPYNKTPNFIKTESHYTVHLPLLKSKE